MQPNDTAMLLQIRNGECLDVRKIGREVETGVYVLDRFQENIDYADPKCGYWIYSIGRHKQTGEIRAAYDTRFYMNPEYECLWLR